MDGLLTWWPVLAFLGSVVVIPAAGWAIRMGLASKAELSAESKDRAAALAALETRLGLRFDGMEREQSELSDRTLRIETEISHLPTSEDISELKASVVRTETRFEGMQREIESIARALARIETHLSKNRS